MFYQIFLSPPVKRWVIITCYKRVALRDDNINKKLLKNRKKKIKVFPMCAISHQNQN